MAIFSSSARETPPMENRRRTDHITLSIIAKDLTVVGNLTSEGVVKIEGTVEGVIRAGTQILIAPGAVVRGDLHTAEAIIGGRIEGTVHATDRVEVQSTAAILGDVMTRRIVVLEGGTVNGAVKMASPPELGLTE
jgi:cytoskeletal protein CcmA (bactofilin family)